LGLVIASRNPDGAPADLSGWAGLSGGAVFCRQYLVGVIIEDPATWAGSLVGRRVDIVNTHPLLRVAAGSPDFRDVSREPFETNWIRKRSADNLAGHIGLDADTPAEVSEHQLVEVLVMRSHSLSSQSAAGDSRTNAVEQKLAPLSEFLDAPGARLIVVGGGGAGKTTMLLRTCVDVTHHDRRQPAQPIPLYVELSLVEARSAGAFESLLECIAEQAGVSKETLRDEWRSGERELLFLLDGLNEVEQEGQQAMLAAIARLMEEKRHRYVITSRPAEVVETFAHQIQAVQRVEVMQLHRYQVRTYFETLGLGLLYRTLSDELTQLAKNPFMLWAITQACARLGGAPLPRNIGELYRLFLDTFIFEQREPHKRYPRLSYSYSKVKRPILSEIAFAMSEMGRTRRHLDDTLYEQTYAALRKIKQSTRHRREVMPSSSWNAEDLLDEIIYNGVLRRDSNSISFMHESVQEYYCAVHLTNQGVTEVVARAPRLLWRHVGERISYEYRDNAWSNPIIMYVGLIDDASDFVTALSTKNPVLTARCIRAAHHVDPSVVHTLKAGWSTYYQRLDERYRLVACRCFEYAGVDDVNDAMRLLELANSDESWTVQFAARRALKTSNTECAQIVIRAALEMDSWRWKNIAEIIADIPHHTTIPLLIEVWQESSATQRRRVEDIFAAVGVDEVRTAIDAIIATSSGEVAESARTIRASIEAWFARADSAYHLYSKIDFDSPEIHQIRAENQRRYNEHLADLGEAPTALVVSRLRADDIVSRRAAAAVLAQRPEQASRNALIEQIWWENDAYIAREIIKALSEHDMENEEIARISRLVKHLKRYSVDLEAIPSRLLALMDNHVGNEPEDLGEFRCREIAKLVSSAEIDPNFDDDAHMRGTEKFAFLTLGQTDRKLLLVRGSAGGEIIDLGRRATAARVLSSVDSEEASRILPTLLRDAAPDDFLKELSEGIAQLELHLFKREAIEALAEVDPVTHSPLFVQLLQTEVAGQNADVVRALVNGLAEAKYLPALPVVLEALTYLEPCKGGGEAGWSSTSSGPILSRRYIDEYDRPSVLTALKSMLLDDRPSARIAAIRELARFGESQDALIDVALTDPEQIVRTWAARFLRADMDTDLVHKFESVLDYGGSEERVAAAEALGNLNDPQGAAKLANALASSNAEVKIAAAWALVSLRDDDYLPEAAATLVQFINNSDAQPDLPLLGARLLGAYPESAKDLRSTLLKEIAYHPDIESSVREIAFDAYGGWESGTALSDGIGCYESRDFTGAIANFNLVIGQLELRGLLPHFQSVASWLRGISRIAVGDIDAGIADMAQSNRLFGLLERVIYAQVLNEAGRRERISEIYSKIHLEPKGYLVEGFISYLGGDYERADEPLKRATAAEDPEVAARAFLCQALVAVALRNDDVADHHVDDGVSACRALGREEQESVREDFLNTLSDGAERGWLDARIVERTRSRIRSQIW
jgi:HEAT repeat protein